MKGKLRILLVQPRTREERRPAAHEVDCIVDRCALEGEETEVWNPLDEPDRVGQKEFAAYHGVIIGASTGGSLADPHRVPEGLLRLRPGLERILRDEIPVFGLCFGHQVLAWHLGAPILLLPDGSRIGTFEVTLTSHGMKDSLFRGLPQRFLVQEAHSCVVMTLPLGCAELAVGPSDALHSIRFGRWAWGVQFHPEVGRRQMIERLQLTQGPKHTHYMIEENAIRDTPEAARVMENFGDLLRERWGQ